MAFEDMIYNLKFAFIIGIGLAIMIWFIEKEWVKK